MCPKADPTTRACAAPGGAGRLREAPTATSSDALPRIPGYELERPLGKGGMGIVYLARESALDRRVALKVLPPAWAADPAAVERFRREARALAKIEHAHIVPIHAIGEQDGLLWFTMAYVEGETLADVLRAAAGLGESRFAPYFLRRRAADHRSDLAACRIAQLVAIALADVHAAGIVHRDVKPGNVMIDQRGRPMLVDFGVAYDPSASRLTHEAVSPGTLRFMPPEHLSTRGAGEADPRADVYALGATLYEMLTLVPAFPQEDMGLLLDAITHGDFQPLRDHDPEVPRDVAEIVERALALEPADRFQSAGEFAEALRCAMSSLADLSGMNGTALGPDLDRALKAVAPVAVTRRFGFTRVTQVLSGRGRRSARRSRRRVALAGAAVLGVTALGAGLRVLTHEPRQDLALPERAVPLPGDGPAIEGVPHAVADELDSYLAVGSAGPLATAGRAWLDGDASTARVVLSCMEEPSDPAGRFLYWHLLAIVGDDQQRSLARRHAERTAAPRRILPPRPGRLLQARRQP